MPGGCADRDFLSGAVPQIIGGQMFRLVLVRGRPPEGANGNPTDGHIPAIPFRIDAHRSRSAADDAPIADTLQRFLDAIQVDFTVNGVLTDLELDDRSLTSMQIGLIAHAYLFNPHGFRRHGTTKINRMIRILRRFPEAVPRLDLEGILHAPFGDRVRVVLHRILAALLW